MRRASGMFRSVNPYSMRIEAYKSFRGFKGLKQAIKLEFKLKRYSQVCSW